MRDFFNIILVIGLAAAGVCGGQAPVGASAGAGVEQQWESLLEKGEPAQAEGLCGSWVKSTEMVRRVEAQKCLANVALARGSQIGVTGVDGKGKETAGVRFGQAYTPQAEDEALGHLNEGIRLAPQDASLHQGRLHVLEFAGRWDAMVQAMEESAAIYKGKDAPDVWLAYAGELANAGEAKTGLRLCEVLDKHYPNNSDVLGNIGAFHSMLKEWDAALPYERRAVELNPTDPIDTWNLGRNLERLGQNEEAAKWMSKAIQLEGPGEGAKADKCLYGQFLVDRMKRTREGCSLVRTSCAVNDRVMCRGKAAAR